MHLPCLVVSDLVTVMIRFTRWLWLCVLGPRCNYWEELCPEEALRRFRTRQSSETGDRHSGTDRPFL